ncbi:DUF3817 domain-containing protein [Sulfurimonas lithotrophica]|uniref:DUF3817 domain-containing protein n=1 Tax=Sulfurimonas lithotrophica TaxID=2590022 RepID=A0A5P8P119_9BACT|nr:DUF3817 domain-containing protein [Sulfurimonas lithotrophica]QFR49310.1 DUF3817 domain-containing protein [Sulfurimonas lithotrophica]
MNQLNLLRYTALTEGVSWLLLLFIAMPLKYVWGDPTYVKVIGMAHGVLFIALIMLLMQNLVDKEIDKKEAIKIFIASFVPFGTFVTDKSLRDAIAIKVRS